VTVLTKLYITTIQYKDFAWKKIYKEKADFHGNIRGNPPKSE
jgi:hypothetical protein